MDEEQLRRRLAANLKVLRRKQGLSQEKLAELTGVSVRMIAFIEGCRTWTSDKTLVKLAKILETDVVQLFSPNLIETAVEDDPQIKTLSVLQKDLTTYINAWFAGVAASQVPSSQVK